MGDTKISWTMGDDGALGKTWNPIRGCSRVSEGCRHCYAERTAGRFCGPGQPYEGLVSIVKRNINHRYVTEARWTGDVRMVPEHLADPLRWRKPRRIFVNSMSDLFHEKLTNEQIAAVFGVMAAAPQHTFQVLTKRAKRMREWFAWTGGDPLVHLSKALVTHGFDEKIRRAAVYGPVPEQSTGQRWPLPNVWLGVSVENQEAADERIPELLATPAAVRFLSCEPLIGPVTLAMRDEDRRGQWFDYLTGRNRVDWCIAGCESGPGARHCDVSWLRSLRDQCAASGVSFFLKQAHEQQARGEGLVRFTTQVATGTMYTVDSGPGSKRKAGGVVELPYLDGVQHAAFPKTP